MDKLERQYYSKIKRNKLNIVETAIKNFEREGILLTESDRFLLTAEAGVISVKQADKVIEVFSPRTYKHLDEAVQPRYVDFLKSEYADQFALRKSKLAAETTFRDLQRVVQRGVKENLTVQQIAKDLQKVKTMSRYRALTVARTETGAAESFATRGTLEQINSVSDEQIYKKWIDAGDGRVRQSHRDANGQIVKENEMFQVGGSALYLPRDPHGAAGEVINCRCVANFYKESEL